MNASTYVGRIGVLAGALGVGAALLAGPGIAGADITATETNTGPAASDAAAAESPGAQASTATRDRVPSNRSARGTRAVSEAATQPSPRNTPTDLDTVVAPDLDTPEITQGDSAQRRSSDSAESAPSRQEFTPPPDAVKASDDIVLPPPSVDATPREPVVPAPTSPLTAPAPAAVLTAPAPAVTSLIETASRAVVSSQIVTTQAVRPGIGAATIVAEVANRISSAVNSVVARLVDTFAGNSPFTPRVDGPASWLLLAAARRQPLAAAAGVTQVSDPVAPTLLVLDGYDVVPNSIETITAFTGRFTYWPGMPNMLQGRQELKLVDPTTKQAVGTFEALVTSGDPTSIGGRYVQLLVTDNAGINVGTGAGQIPPVGSMISSLSLGLFGVSYSAMPSPSGDKVSVKFTTPFGNIALPITYDASKGIADRTFDNRPMELGDGFRIAPAEPDAEEITATIGLLPLFNSVQGRQTFGIFDATGKSVGNFVGEFTTTSDIVSIYTQAIRVIANDGVNIGTKPGQTPPVGTVYNVAYFGSDDVYLLYASLPQPSGVVISITAKTPLGVFDVPPWVFNSFNASTEPPIKSLTAPGGQRFVATSPQLPAGVNGLPPRDIQTQGYQQFDVIDFLGRNIGSIDTNVASQWDGFGVHSKSLLITEVREGKTGSTPFEVPPVGSVLNFIYFTGGFGLVDAVIPLNGLQLNALNILTPIGAIPLLPLPLPVGNRPRVEYFNPFLV